MEEDNGGVYVVLAVTDYGETTSVHSVYMGENARSRAINCMLGSMLDALGFGELHGGFAVESISAVNDPMAKRTDVAELSTRCSSDRLSLTIDGEDSDLSVEDLSHRCEVVGDK